MRLVKKFVFALRVRMNLGLTCLSVPQDASGMVLLASIWHFNQDNPTLIYISEFFKFDVQHQTRQSRQLLSLMECVMPSPLPPEINFGLPLPDFNVALGRLS